MALGVTPRRTAAWQGGVRPQGAPNADVGVTKVDGATTATPGSTTTYTIVVSNAGPTPSGNIAVSDPLPVGVTSATWSGTNGSSGTGALNDTISSLANGASVTYTMIVQISPAATGTLVNTVTATPPPVVDPNLTNNTAIDTDTLTPAVPALPPIVMATFGGLLLLVLLVSLRRRTINGAI